MCDLELFSKIWSQFIFFENKVTIGLSLTETSYALARNNSIIFRKLSLLSEIDTFKMQTYNQSANPTHLIDLKSRNQRFRADFEI